MKSKQKEAANTKLWEEVHQAAQVSSASMSSFALPHVEKEKNKCTLATLNMPHMPMPLQPQHVHTSYLQW